MGVLQRDVTVAQTPFLSPHQFPSPQNLTSANHSLAILLLREDFIPRTEHMNSQGAKSMYVSCARSHWDRCPHLGMPPSPRMCVHSRGMEIEHSVTSREKWWSPNFPSWFINSFLTASLLPPQNLPDSGIRSWQCFLDPPFSERQPLPLHIQMNQA